MVRLTDREREALADLQPGGVIITQPYNRRVLGNLVRKRVLCQIIGGGYTCGPMWEKRER